MCAVDFLYMQPTEENGSLLLKISCSQNFMCQFCVQNESPGIQSFEIFVEMYRHFHTALSQHCKIPMVSPEYSVTV